jgi:alkanesulfonate monooxygenase SsuD/methylene tetrahydromethanopterin reductase-like flavin-dependent oxidoreductase (luciferase family)
VPPRRITAGHREFDAGSTQGRRQMQFGVQFFPAVDHTDKSAADYFAESLAIAEEADTLGFTHARTVEHYFTRYGGYSPNPIVFLSAVSQRTRALRLVTGAVLPVFNHPFKLAGEIAMLDGISGGRLDVGFARAFLPHEFRRFGISPDESHARFREGLEQIELLLTRENASHRGEFHSFENVTSLPRPTQTPRPKFYIAATQTPESFEFAGSKGYALMAIPIGPIGPLLARYREAWRAAGHPGDGEVMVAFHMLCHRDARLAREIARPPFEEYFRALNEAVGEWERGTTSKDYRDYDTSARALRAFTLDGQIASGGAWVGTPEEIRAIIRRVVETIGTFEHASLQINFGALDLREAQRSMRLFAAEVMPEFADAAPAGRQPAPLAQAW